MTDWLGAVLPPLVGGGPALFTAKSLATWQPVKCIPSGVICMGVGAIGSAAATVFDQLDSGLKFNASIPETNDMSPAYYRGATMQGIVTCSGTNSGKETLHPFTVEVFYRAQIDGAAAGVLPGRLTIGFPGRSPWQGVTDALLDWCSVGTRRLGSKSYCDPRSTALILRCGRHNGYDCNLSDFIDTITKILAPANLAAAAAVLQSGPYPSIDGHALAGVQVELGICIAARLNPLLIYAARNSNTLHFTLLCSDTSEDRQLGWEATGLMTRMAVAYPQNFVPLVEDLADHRPSDDDDTGDDDGRPDDRFSLWRRSLDSEKYTMSSHDSERERRRQERRSARLASNEETRRAVETMQAEMQLEVELQSEHKAGVTHGDQSPPLQSQSNVHRSPERSPM